MPAKIDAAELSPEVRARLGIPDPEPSTRRSRVGGRRKAERLTADNVRTLALRVLNVVADLTPSERARVLRHASKVNEV